MADTFRVTERGRALSFSATQLDALEVWCELAHVFMRDVETYRTASDDLIAECEVTGQQLHLDYRGVCHHMTRLGGERLDGP